MEVGQGPHWGCSAKEKKKIKTTELNIQIGHKNWKCDNLAETTDYLISRCSYWIASVYLRTHNRCAIYSYIRSRVSYIGTATGYGIGFPKEATNFLCSIASRPALRPTQPPIQWVQGLFPPAVKGRGRENDHSPPSNAAFKNGGAIPPLPHTPSWRAT
jgi:hypothetical protein